MWWSVIVMCMMCETVQPGGLTNAAHSMPPSSPLSPSGQRERAVVPFGAASVAPWGPSCPRSSPVPVRGARRVEECDGDVQGVCDGPARRPNPCRPPPAPRRPFLTPRPEGKSGVPFRGGLSGPLGAFVPPPSPAPARPRPPWRPAWPPRLRARCPVCLRGLGSSSTGPGPASPVS